TPRVADRAPAPESKCRPRVLLSASTTAPATHTFREASTARCASGRTGNISAARASRCADELHSRSHPCPSISRRSTPAATTPTPRGNSPHRNGSLRPLAPAAPAAPQALHDFLASLRSSSCAAALLDFAGALA